ncbi:hypothetical protein ncot_01385 [Nocardioides sp. JQ2195]|uniref:PxKF domain-containing protein n=1 Tax=Nocardioides sp. JQ2195 TaxID=2592334 RepID=UPI00143E6177|nr:PxKF domain-containing protein [Nocardioides sp. JQ2195]QIX25390.1 hypothetical protein ncot_01385 [Nocardioides sp. JQ2195]
MRVTKKRNLGRRRLVRASALTALTMSAALALNGVATADDIHNDLDATIDAAAEVMPLNVGTDGTTTLYLQPRNGDGNNGCNLTGQTTLTLSVTSSDTSVATVSPSSVTFTSCGDTKALTVHPVATGSATVSAAEVASSGQGSFNLAPATFTVNVAGPSNTAPTVEVAGVDGGASYAKGSVPAATCEVTDAEDGPSSFPATLSAVTGEYAVDGIGTQTASCDHTDAGGLQASASETYSVVDASAPVITYTLDPAEPDGDHGWYRGDVSLTWHVSEPESPSSVVTTGCVDQAVTSDQSLTDYACSATSAGGASAEQTVSIQRDGSAPAAPAGTLSPAPNAAGWNNTDLVVSFSDNGDEGPSGVAGCTADVPVTEETAGRTVTGTCTDLAGNTSAGTEVAVKLDRTAPAVPTFVGGPEDDIYYGDDLTAPTCESSDALSGLASCVVSGGGTSVGTHTWTATATDLAGNTSTATLGYEVLAWTLDGFQRPVDMSGVWNTVKGGSTVPLKFEVLVGPTELTDTSAIAGFRTAKVSCTSGISTEDSIEIVSTGGTSLRYDATGGQFIQNWKTPTGAGSCYTATVTTLDGSSISARFKIK